MPSLVAAFKQMRRRGLIALREVYCAFAEPHAIGLERLQEVICYELRSVPPDAPRGTLAFRRIDPHDPHDLGVLMGVDHAAFHQRGEQRERSQGGH